MCTDPASFGRAGDRWGIANTELVFKKEKEGVQLVGPESSWFIKVCSCKTRTSGTDLPLFISHFICTESTSDCSAQGCFCAQLSSIERKSSGKEIFLFLRDNLRKFQRPFIC